MRLAFNPTFYTHIHTTLATPSLISYPALLTSPTAPSRSKSLSKKKNQKNPKTIQCTENKSNSLANLARFGIKKYYGQKQKQKHNTQQV